MSRAAFDPQPVQVEKTRWWEPAGEAGAVRCLLCPRRCLIRPDRAGYCAIRVNVGGRLASLGYGSPVGLSVDPIEKKPLYHFLPGSGILSFGTYGCNLGCRFCQNWQMSRGRPPQRERTRLVLPEELVRLARQEGCPSIAFTYNDPTVFAEYAIDVAQAAREQGIRCVAVTAGYIERQPRLELFGEVAAANIDLKALDDAFYRRWSRVKLQPVLETIEWVHHETSCFVELTNLLIPGLNDSEPQVRALVDWVLERLGPDVPLHFSAFHPAHQMTDRSRTPLQTLLRARELARASGVHHVYVGNVFDPEQWKTRCPVCQQVLIDRSGWVPEVAEGFRGRCPGCGAQVAGIWE